MKSKQFYRIYCGLKFNLRRKTKNRLPTRTPEPPAVPASANANLLFLIVLSRIWTPRFLQLIILH